MASLEITHFWSNSLAWGYQRIFKYYGHCYGSSISEGPAPQTEQGNSRGGDGPRRLNGERSAGAYIEARSKATWRVNSRGKSERSERRARGCG